MNKTEYTDFLQFLLRKRLIAGPVVAAMITKCDGSVAIQGNPSDKAARLILAELNKHGFSSTTPPEALISEWQGSVQSTNALRSSQRMLAPADLADNRPHNAPTIAPEPARDGSPRSIGPFRIERKLGQGGMGAVFLGHHKDMGFPAAVKIIAAQPGDIDAIERFKREVKITITVRHPNLIHTFGADLDHNPRYIALEYIEGDKLDQAMRDLPPGQVRVVLEKVRDLCRGVQACHNQGIVHRDLKPDNVLVDKSGRVVVLDPGMARPIDKSSLTSDGEIVGTPMYMAPEQMDRLPEDKYTPAVDVYAIGKILFYLLTRTHVHSAAGMMALMQLVLTKPLPDHVVPSLKEVLTSGQYERVGPIVLKCLQPKPQDRYANAGELAEAIDVFLVWDRNHEQNEREAREQELQKRRAQVRKLIVAASLAAAVGLLVLLLLVFVEQSRKAEAKARQEANARAEAESRARELETTKAEVARKLVVAQTYVSAADWPNAIRELREIVAKDPETLSARWLLADALFNIFDPSYLEQYRWLAEHVTDPAEKTRAQFWVIFAGLDRGGLKIEEALPLLDQIRPGLYRDLAHLYIAGHQQTFHAALAFAARRDSHPDEAERETRESQQWAAKAREMLGRLDADNWLVAYVHGFLVHSEDPELARERLTYAISHNPSFAMAYFWRAAVVQENVTHPEPIAAVQDAERLHVLMPGWPKGELMRSACCVAMAQYWERESKLARNPTDRSALVDTAVSWTDKAVSIVAEYKSWQGGDVYAQFGGGIEGHTAYALYHKTRILRDAGRREEAQAARQLALQAIDRLRACRQRAPLTQEMEALYQQLPPALEAMR